MVSKKTSILLLVSFMALLLLVNVLLKPIPQLQSYHNFADQRTLFGMTNVWNVLSNIPLALGGMWGLFLLLSPHQLQFIDSRERWPWIGFSIGLILTAAGSSFYHLAPDNARLVWDRLPMTIVFMSFMAILINERISVRLGLLLWPFLLGIGIYSVLQWQASELQGAGDLRLYASVQVYTMIAAAVLLLTPSHYTRSLDLVVVVIFYVLAKIFELFDKQIYLATDNIISGHTLKHLAVGFAGIWLIQMLWRRKQIIR